MARKMVATITSLPYEGMQVEGRTLKEIRGKMIEMLSVDGPRGLTAIVDNGAEIHVELYEGRDYIRTADGRIIK